MRKAAPKIVALLVALTLALTMALPAAASKKKAKKSLRASRDMLKEVIYNVDAAAAAAGVDLRFGDVPSSKKDKKKEKKEKKAKKDRAKAARHLKKLRKQTSALYAHLKVLKKKLPKRDAKQAKKLKKLVKELKAMVKAIHRDKPQRDLWAVVEVEKKLEKILKLSRKWAGGNAYIPGRDDSASDKPKDTGPHAAARAIINNMKASIEQVRGVSERLRHKDRAASSSIPPREELERYAEGLRADASRLLDYWQGQKKKKKEVKAAKALLKRIQPVDRAIANVPKKPWKSPKALARLEAALTELIDGHADEIDILAWSWGTNP